MPSYRAPLADIRFVIHDLIGLGPIQALPGYGEVGADLVDAVLVEADRFASEVLAPLNPVGDRQGCVLENGVVRTPTGFADAYNDFVAGGWNGIHFPTEYGGQELPRLIATAVGEIWTAANMAFALCPMLTQAAVEVVLAYGSEEMKALYLPRLVSGEWTGTMNLTEPQAGSDLNGLRTRAVRDGDRYRITGQKIFITYGEHDLTDNIIHIVLARTPDSPQGVKGLSLFLVPKILVNDDGSLGARNDVRCVSIEHKLGINASPTALLSYGDGGGAVGYLIGEENRGIELMFMMMNNARLAVGLEGVGIADRAFQRALGYARDRFQGRETGADDPLPVPISHHPDVQRMLLSMKAGSEATRALAYFVAAALDTASLHTDAGERRQALALVDLLTPVVKGWSTDVGIEVASTGIQVLGGMGYIEESGAPQHLRDARIAAIYEGTNGIQANDLVGRKVARDGGVAARALIARIRGSDAKLADSRNPHVAAIRERLRNAVADFAECTDWLLQTYPHDPRRVMAGAVHYMHLTGIVTGGWLMAEAARIAAERLGARSGDPQPLLGKLVTARFFADTGLSQTTSLKTQFMHSGEALAAIDPDRDI
jgi:alkylation response protein AidB-like acyl-CoA dehydrogenase